MKAIMATSILIPILLFSLPMLIYIILLSLIGYLAVQLVKGVLKLFGYEFKY